MAGIIDELTSELSLSAPQAAPKEYRPSSYNPFTSYPEGLWHELSSGGSQAYQGAKELGQGHLLSGAWDVGMGGLRAAYSPIEAGIQTATYPLSDVTGIPEPYLDIAANLGMMAPGLARGGARMLGRGAEAAAPVAEAGGAMPAFEGASSMPDLAAGAPPTWANAMRGGQRMPPLEATRDVASETAWAKQQGEDLLRQHGWQEPKQLEYRPAMPDLRPQWGKPQYESGIPMGDTRTRWGAPQGLPPEEPMFGGRMHMPEQQLPNYTPSSAESQRMAASAARVRDVIGSPSEQAFQALKNARQYMGFPETRPTRQIEPRGARPSEVAARGAEDEAATSAMRGRAEAARAAQPDIETLMAELKPARKLTEAELKTVATDDARIASKAKSTEFPDFADKLLPSLEGTGKTGGLGYPQIKALFPDMTNRPLARALKDFASRNAEKVDVKYHPDSGNVTRIIPLTKDVQEAIQLVKVNLGDLAGHIRDKELMDLLTYGPETQASGRRALSAINAKRAIKFMKESGRLTKKATDPETGETIYWFTARPEPKV